MKNKHTIKLVTYNVDGLPETLDLKDLPWILKPVAWVYKLFKKTTKITANDGKNHSAEIGDYLSKTDADLIAVQEDFNYHEELMNHLPDYYAGTHGGEITLKNLFSNTEWLSYFPFPRFKADGLNLLVKDDRVEIYDEDIVWWKKSAGYFKHANDKLTHKGFRRYSVVVDDEYDIDVYIVHFDADFYNPKTCPDVSKDIAARKAQYDQLMSYIQAQNSSNPIVIIGDMNNINEWSIGEEAISTNGEDIDRVFIINNGKCPYKLSVEDAYRDKDVHLSDHRPFIVTLKIED